MSLGRTVEFSKRYTGIGTGNAQLGVHIDRLQVAEIDDDAVVTGREAGDAVPPASYGDGKSSAGRQGERALNIRSPFAERYQRRPAIGGRIPDPPGSIE